MPHASWLWMCWWSCCFRPRFCKPVVKLRGGSSRALTTPERCTNCSPRHTRSFLVRSFPQKNVFINMQATPAHTDPYHFNHRQTCDCISVQSGMWLELRTLHFSVFVVKISCRLFLLLSDVWVVSDKDAKWLPSGSDVVMAASWEDMGVADPIARAPG